MICKKYFRHRRFDVFHCSVTRPLLRQIENLQTTYAAQTASYERVEKSLTDRLGEFVSIEKYSSYFDKKDVYGNKISDG